MAEPGSLGGLAEQLVLGAIGAISLTAERADQLADELAERGGMRRDEARALVRDLATRWRGDALRVGERTGSNVQGALKQLGLVVREEFDELELRLAQLEHRVRLLESRVDAPAAAVSPPRRR